MLIRHHFLPSPTRQHHCYLHINAAKLKQAIILALLLINCFIANCKPLIQQKDKMQLLYHDLMKRQANSLSLENLLLSSDNQDENINNNNIMNNNNNEFEFDPASLSSSAASTLSSSSSSPTNNHHHSNNLDTPSYANIQQLLRAARPPSNFVANTNNRNRYYNGRQSAFTNEDGILNPQLLLAPPSRNNFHIQEHHTFTQTDPKISDLVELPPSSSSSSSSSPSSAASSSAQHLSSTSTIAPDDVEEADIFPNPNPEQTPEEEGQPQLPIFPGETPDENTLTVEQQQQQTNTDEEQTSEDGGPSPINDRLFCKQLEEAYKQQHEHNNEFYSICRNGQIPRYG